MQTPYGIKKSLEYCANNDCKSCSYSTYGNGAYCINAMIHDALSYINQLEQRLASVGKTCQEWISVDDRLPKHGQIVFCYTKYFYEVLQWGDDSEQWCGQNSVNAKHYVTHWMPLPEPPKEE